MEVISTLWDNGVLGAMATMVVTTLGQVSSLNNQKFTAVLETLQKQQSSDSAAHDSAFARSGDKGVVVRRIMLFMAFFVLAICPFIFAFFGDIPIVGERKYYLAPFSIRKKSNVYGLIFGSAHILGLQKFQKSCWNISPDFGDANFNIDNDFNVDANMTLFYNASKSEKILDFEKKLTSFIKSRECVTNYDVLLFGLKSGFSVKKIQEALISINESLKLELDGLDGYKPTNKTFGITEKTYQQKKLSYIKISQ